jgi:hypothetical protein
MRKTRYFARPASCNCSRVVRVFVGLLSTLALVAAAENYALLVGCSEYPKLSPGHSLRGPTNDVDLVAELLTSDRFKFKPKNITALAGWPAKGKLRPTRNNIMGAFNKLIRNAKDGDQIFILMSGHGSQQPANEDPNDRETDGFDEIFLPADAQSWEGDGDVQTVKYAIVDDEVRELLKRRHSVRRERRQDRDPRGVRRAA